MTLLHPKLAHLSSAELEGLIKGYTEGELISALLKRFNIDCHPSKLFGLLPPIVVEGQKCTYCSGQMVKERSSRGKVHPDDSVRCSVCYHSPNSRCSCEHCLAMSRKAKQNELDGTRAEIANYCGRRHHGVIRSFDIEGLSFKAAIGFIALVRSCQFTDQSSNSELEKLEDSPFPFAPKMIYAFDVLTHLMASDLIALSETSSEDAFRFKGGKIEFYLPLKVRWRIRYEAPVDLIREIESRARDGYWPTSWLNQVKDFWTELAIAECQEFFEYLTLQRGFPPAGEKATIDMLSNILKTYSVAQAMQILLKGAKDAADFSARTNCSLQHASNYMISASRRYADRATAEKWTITGLRRNYDLPQSALSTVLHDVFLRHGEKGFIQCPREWH